MKTLQEQIVSTEELAGIFKLFNETTARLEESHKSLQKRVEELQKELAEKSEELERKKRLAALGEMAAAVAHEIRNPLGGIGLCAGLLKRELADERNSGLVEKIISGVNNLNSVVEGMLVFTRNISPRFVRCNLADVVRQAISSLERAIKNSRTAVALVAPKSEIIVQADGALLGRAFSNIIENAIQAINGEGRIEVRLTARPNGGAEIAFEDSGPGISEDIIEKVFNPLFTERGGGTGLGLAIVHRIVEAHGGRVIAENMRDGGAKFTVLLPHSSDAGFGIGQKVTVTNYGRNCSELRSEAPIHRGKLVDSEQFLDSDLSGASS